MCRGAFISVVFAFLVYYFSAAYKERQNSDEKINNLWIKLRHTKKRHIIYIYGKSTNALLFTKVPIRPTQTDGGYVSVYDFFFSILFSFFVLECAHILCKTLLLYFPYL